MTKCMNMKCSMERRNLREASYCHYVHTIYCSMAHMSVMLASRLLHISSWRRIASSHCWREANWPSIPALMRRMVLYTLCLVACVIIDAGSSRSCAASDGSWRWISPSVAVLTGAEFPLAPPTARGGGM